MHLAARVVAKAVDEEWAKEKGTGAAKAKAKEMALGVVWVFLKMLTRMPKYGVLVQRIERLLKKSMHMTFLSQSPCLTLPDNP